MVDQQLIVGRREERAELDLALTSPGAELVAVYGRRRVGKTFLIRQHFRNHILFETVGLHDGNLARQLANFHHSLRTAFPQMTSVQPKNWLEAFELLRPPWLTRFRQARNKRSGYCSSTSSRGWRRAGQDSWLPSRPFGTQYASERRDPDCHHLRLGCRLDGPKSHSCQGGLHNRLTRRLRLTPFTLGETQEFLQSRGVQLEPFQIALIYMAVGGIPLYLNHIRPGRSAAQNIEALCFRPTGMLREEYDSY